MSVFQYLNQLKQTPLKGLLAALPNMSTLSVQVTPASSNTLLAGSAVKLVSGTGTQILVDLAGATDVPFGFVIYNSKKNSYTAGKVVEIALTNSVVYLESFGAIERGNPLEWYPTGHRVRQNAGVNPVCGIALDKVSGSGELLRVNVKTVLEYSSSSSSCSSSSSSCRSSSSSCSSSSSKSSSSSSSSSYSSSSSSSSNSSSSSSSSSNSSSSSSSSSA